MRAPACTFAFHTTIQCTHARPHACRRLSDKIRSFYSYVADREVNNDEATVIAGLSTNLRMQASMHDCLKDGCFLGLITPVDAGATFASLPRTCHVAASGTTMFQPDDALGS